MANAYKWKIFEMPVDAQTAGEYIEGLANQYGMVTPKRLVDESREVGAVLHDCFEWDDTKAAEGYREHQAGEILRNLKIEVISDKPDYLSEDTMRAFVNVVNEKTKQRGYVQTYVAMNDESYRAQVLHNAYNDLCNFKNRYEQFVEVAEELQPIFSAIDQLGVKIPN